MVCVVCGSDRRQTLFSVPSVPIHPFCPPTELGLKPGFGRMEAAACAECGHIYNAAFEAARADDLYAANVLTNTPVSEGMIRSVEGTADFIRRHARRQSTVLEVGGGSGALALALARDGAEVHLVEPSRVLKAADFARHGVTLHQTMFPVDSLATRRFDIVAARQVTEHIPDPQLFLNALRAHCADCAAVYIEVPCAEYIISNASVVDFHYPHVHYFRSEAIETMLARAGFAVVEKISIKDGHDLGLLLRPVAPDPDLAAPIAPSLGEVTGRLSARRLRGEAKLMAITGDVALYGANAYSQALLGLYPAAARFVRVFDDTPMYIDLRAYGPKIDLPIGPPTAEALSKLAAVVITAYLHDAPIATKLRAMGYGGAIYTVRADELAGRGERPPTLFG